MKKLLIAALTLCGAYLGAQAQQMPQLPADTAVVVGKLPNGLTYYIRHNEYPKGQADFHIAQKVGSILEEDNQRGLAHFLEHMCFNGTKNYPGNSLVSYLESIGVKFGQHLNAYTGTDETVYMITNVPTANTAVTDSVLLVLHDWANDLLLEPEEIDKERKVIHEEWRSRNVGQMRILDQVLPTIYPGSKYAHRMPIGTMEVVDNFPYQALRDYYEAWYRPDLQGIVVSGDIDVKRTEDVIKKMFGDIEMPANAPERVEFPVPDTPGTIYAVGADKEQTNSLVYLMFKQEAMPKEMRNTGAYLMFDYLTDMIAQMLNARFSEMQSKPDTPFAVAQTSYENYMLSNTEDMLAVIGVAKDNDIVTTLKSIYRELLRATRGGFTQSEYDRAKAEYLSRLEKRFNNRANVENSTYTNEMIRTFIDGVPMLAIEDLYQTMQQLTQYVNIDMINATLKEMVTDDNRVVLCMLPETGAALPDEKTLDEAMKAVDAEEIEVFTDNVREDPLIPSLAAPGTVKSTSALKEFDAQTWTLSNGATVIVKPTQFKQDEIVLEASAPGGLLKHMGNASVADVRVMDLYAGNYGIGAYNNSDLQKYLTGKQCGISPSVGRYSSSIHGTSTPKDLPTFFELIYGYFTSLNYPEDEYAATQSLYYGLLQNQENNPQFIFQRDVAKSMYKSPYLQTMTAQDIKDATRQGIQSLFQAQVADASAWTFTFVGNFDQAQLRELCEKYIANLPGSGKKAKPIKKADKAFETVAGSGTDTYTTKMETPQTYCMVNSSATIPFTSLNQKLTSFAGQILSARLIKNIREEMGAVYSISAASNLSPYEGRNARILIPFPMNPDKKQVVLDAIRAEFDAMAQNITDEEFNKVREYMVKSYTEELEKNGEWADAIDTWNLTGQNTFTQAVAEVNSITPKMVQEFVKKMNAQGNYRVVILDPEN